MSATPSRQLQPDDFPARVRVGETDLQMVPGQLLLHLAEPAGLEELRELLGGRTFRVLPGGSALARQRARDRRFRDILVEIDELGGLTRDPSAALAWIETVLGPHRGRNARIRSAAPVYAATRGQARLRVAPVPERLLVRVDRAAESTLAELAGTYAVEPVDVERVFPRTRPAEKQAGVTGDEIARQAVPLTSDVTASDGRATWLLRHPDFVPFAWTALREAAAMLPDAEITLDIRDLDPWLGALPAAFDPARHANLNAIHAPDVWAQGITGAGVRVAVLDTGFDIDHPSLTGQFDEAAFFNTEEATDLGQTSGFDVRSTGEGHGTAVASVIAGRHDVNHPALGLAPGCTIIPIRLGSVPSTFEIALGLRWAAAQGARVANLSFKTIETSDVSDEISAIANETGMLIVAAAGNRGYASGSPVLPFPARHPSVIAAGAADTSGRRRIPGHSGDWGSQYTQDGSPPQVCVVAPGVNCTAADDTVGGFVDGDVFFDGQATSIAAPQVSGLAALLLSANSALTAAQVKRAIQRGAWLHPGYTATGWTDDQGIRGHPEVGYGRIDCARSLSELDNPGELDEIPQPAGEGVPMTIRRSGAGPEVTVRDLYSPDEVVARDQLIDRIEGDSTRCLVGVLLADRDEGGKQITRLYFTENLDEWVDIPADAALMAHRDDAGSGPFGTFRVWVAPTCMLTFSRRGWADDFLRGEIAGAPPQGDAAQAEALLQALRQLMTGGRSGSNAAWESVRGPCFQSVRGPCFQSVRGPC